MKYNPKLVDIVKNDIMKKYNITYYIIYIFILIL